MRKADDEVKLDSEWLKLLTEAMRLGFIPDLVRSMIHPVAEITASEERPSKHETESVEDSGNPTVE